MPSGWENTCLIGVYNYQAVGYLQSTKNVIIRVDENNIYAETDKDINEYWFGKILILLFVKINGLPF